MIVCEQGQNEIAEITRLENVALNACCAGGFDIDILISDKKAIGGRQPPCLKAGK